MTSTAETIRRESVPGCPLCGLMGSTVLYDGLEDRLFGAAGTWRMRRCAAPQCRHLWLDPRPIEEDIGRVYDTYYTHAPLQQRPMSRLRTWVRQGYYARRFGYQIR